MKVGAIIKAARQRMGLTLSELAELVGSSTSTLSSIENDHLKNSLSPSEMVAISDAILDRRMLSEYCDRCPVRGRILPRKFLPLNNVLVNAHASTLKTAQKLSEAADKLQNMLGKMLKKDFQADPEYKNFRDEAILKILDAKRGAEILLDQLLEQGIVSAEELRMLVNLQQRLCVDKGHHIEEMP